MARVYSTQFIQARDPGIIASYAVPAGQLAIIRDWRMTSLGNPGDTQFTLYLGNANAIIDTHLFVNPNEVWSGQGRIVVPFPQIINVEFDGPNLATALVSGYLLDLP